MQITLAPIILIPLAVIAFVAALVGVIYLIVPVFKGIGWLVRHLFRFVFGVIGDSLRLIGTVISSIVLVPITVVSVIIGRWSAASHYGRAINAEFKTAVGCLYRLAIGHPARLLCLHALTEGIEQRVPQVVAAAPGADKPAGRAGQFEGYTIIGSLPGGGSGGKLYVAEPTPVKAASLARAGFAGADRVVIKTFSLRDGSSLPQIVRENRALDAAKRLGLILEHELTNDRFFYVMKYVPGDSLGLATQRLHAAAGTEGLSGRPLKETLEYACDLLRTLCHYHSGGLWHKDVKPDNIIVAGGQAHLVDFGLVTPLRSSMTLTTHGTEYFRDPEMVRMALKGVKVHEVDGAKFDLYAAGAVLYSMIENSFPAHGGLSQISKRCPEAVRWIVRRAMTDYDKRYESAATMLADLETVLRAEDPFAVLPGILPSVRGMDAQIPDAAVAASPTPAWSPLPAAAAAAAFVPAAFGAGVNGAAAAAAGVAPAFAAAQVAAAAPAGAPFGANPAAAAAAFGAGTFVRAKPRLRVVDWWSGRYEQTGTEAFTVTRASANAAAAAPFTPVSARVAGPSGTAREQIERARARAVAAQERARARMASIRPSGNYTSGLNIGVGVAVVAFMLTFFAAVALFFTVQSRNQVFVNMPQAEEADLPAAEFSRANDGRILVTGSSGTALVRVQNAEFNDRTLETCALWRDYTEDRQKISNHGYNVLILRGGTGLDPEDLARTGEVAARLAEQGFKVSGEVPETAEGFDPAIEQTSDLRKNIGTTVFGSDDGLKSIQTWMDRNKSISMVVWLGSDESGTEEVFILPRDTVDLNSMDAAASAMRVLVN